ncbi:TetR/AcrR family transcriptional regulator [Gordonia sp. MP11Mi]|uniref:HTH-type transcriptional regulator AqdR n=1 Tax=Gordonia sp. MP11Mi TaxID=3022769 RepID=A0AA97CTV7_9ACTN
MADDQSPVKARRPGGRSARVRAAVLEATLVELVEKGYAGLSVDGVATRSGVHRTSIYRRWSNREALLVAALESPDLLMDHPPDTGSFDDDLRIYSESAVEVLNGPPGAVLRALLVSEASSLESVARVIRNGFLTLRSSSLPMVERAMVAGAVPVKTDAVDVMDHLLAPIYFRFLRSDEPVDVAVATQGAAATVVAARAGVFVRDR